MRLTRRSVLAGAVLAGSRAYAASALWRDGAVEPRAALRIPELIDARGQPQTIRLAAQEGGTELFPGRSSPTVGYNRAYLGPTMRLRLTLEVGSALLVQTFPPAEDAR